jgi:serine/threonine-protein kinase
MGVVYRAVRAPDEETVALKVLRGELSADETFRKRFAREGELASSLDHDHLIPVLDYGELEGRYFMAARYVGGRSLAERLKEARFDAPQITRLIAHVGSALDAVHGQGLVHRDVKPANIIVDEAGSAALTDFGVARGQAHTVLTKQGRVVGTPDYLAPEVIRGERAVPATDLYGLGCVGYECAAGSPPFAAKRTIAETCLAHLNEQPPDLATRRPDLPWSFIGALLRALAKDPSERPTTGMAYARLLRAGAKRL